MARPTKEIDKQRFEMMCKCFCTEQDIADEFNCSIDTVCRWCQREFGQSFADTYKKLSMYGKNSLRAKQFALAMNGNAPMLIWLGKQHLGQKDKTETDLNGSLKLSIAQQITEAFKD